MLASLPLRGALVLIGLAATVAFAQPRRPVAPPGADGAVPPIVEDVPNGALARLGSVRFRAGVPLSRVVFSPDGKYIVVGGGDGRISWWNVTTGRVEFSVPFAGGTITRLAFSPDGKHLAVAGQAGHLGVFDAATHERKFLDTPSDNSYRIRPIAWRDAKSLVVADALGNIRIINADSGEEQKSYRVELRTIVSLACSPDGKQAAGIAVDGKMQAWDLDKGTETVKFELPESAAAPGANDPQVIGAPPPIAPRPASMRTQLRPAAQLAWSADGKYIVAGSTLRHVPVWDAKTGKVVRQFANAGNAGGLAFFPSSRFLAVTAMTGTLHIYGLASGAELRTIDSTRDPTNDLAISTDGTLIATVGSGATIRVLEIDTGRDRAAVAGHKGAISGLAFLGDGKRLVTAGQDSTFIVWDAAAGKERERITHVEARVTSIAPTPDGQGVIYSSGQLHALTWAPGAAEPRRNLPTFGGGYAPVISSDGRVVAHPTGQAIRLCDADTGKERGRIEMRGYLDAARLAVSPHGRFIAAIMNTADRKLQVWTADGKSRPLFVGEQEVFYPERLVFSADGRLLAAIAQGYVRVWEAISGAPRLRQLPIPATAYTAVAFTPDDQTLILGARDGALRLVDLANGQVTDPIAAHVGQIDALAVSADGKYLASGSADSTVVMWDLPELLKRVPRFPLPVQITPEQRDTWWANLGSNDPAAAGDAIWALTHLPDEAVALFKERLRGVKAPDKDKIKQWIKELDDDRFAVRERALKALTRAGEDAKELLQDALTHNPSDEVKRRVEQLLKNLTTGVPAAKLQPLRAIAILEKIDRPEVKTILKELARQSTDDDVKQEIAWVLGQKK
jgi:WD40 repeat protein